MSTALNMEQMSLSSLPSGLSYRDGQAYFNDSLNISSYLSGDIVQQALDGLNLNLLSPTHVDLNKPINLNENYFVLDKNNAQGDKTYTQGEDGVVQLSISDDFPMHLLNSGKSVETAESHNDTTSLLDSLLGPESVKSDNSLSLDSLSSFFQVPPSNNLPQLNISNSDAKGNSASAYKLVNESKNNQGEQGTYYAVPIKNVNQVNSVAPEIKSVETLQQDPKKQSQKKFIILKVLRKGAQNNVQKLKIVSNNPVVTKKQKSIPNPINNFEQNSIPTQNANFEQKNIPTQNSNFEQKNISTKNTNFEQRSIPTQNTNFVINNFSNLDTVGLHQSDNIILLQNVDQAVSSNTFQNLLSCQAVEASNNLSSSGNSITSTVGVLNGNVPDTSTTVVPDSSSVNEIPTPSSPVKQAKLTKRLTEEELQRLATAFQNGELKLDKSNNVKTLYDSKNNSKIICRVLYPDELNINKDNKQEKSLKATSTRKNTKAASRRKTVNSASPKRTAKATSTKNTVQPTSTTAPPEAQLENTVVEKPKIKKQKTLARTRSGRLSRPPRHMKEVFKKLNVFSCTSESSSEEENEVANENIENTPAVLDEIEMRRHKKKSICPTCGKVYFGKKMLIHFTKYPDHGDVNTLLALIEGSQQQKPTAHFHRLQKEWKKAFTGKQPKADAGLLKELLNICSKDILLTAAKEQLCKIVSPWDYLYERQPAGDGAVRGLLSDLTDIFNSIPANILHKADPCDPNAIHITDERLCGLLNISPGVYLPNDNAFKPLPEPVEIPDPWSMETEALLQEKPVDKMDCSLDLGKKMDCSLDSDSKMDCSLDLDKKLDCSLDMDKKVSGPDLTDLLDKSSLQSVDEILEQRLNDLIPLDVSLLVESQSLDRSLFSTSSLELNSVSESTEDLLKTLENFNSELPNVPVPTDFDFAVLTTDFVNDR